MLPRLKKALAVWFRTRAHRESVGGTWYLVCDLYGGGRGWTQHPEDDVCVLEVEHYEQSAPPPQKEEAYAGR